MDGMTAAPALTTLPAGELVLAAAFLAAVVGVMISDIRFLIIPDALTAAIAGLGLVAILSPAADRPDAVLTLVQAGVGALGSMAALLLVRWGHTRITGRDGLGLGDVKLMGALTVWLDPGDASLALAVAALAALGLVALRVPFDRRWRDGGAVVPFGAFLAPAAWLVWVAGASGLPRP
jgi:prepilin signal peptidase PulO-like enzyme (type II secretory pathway)